MRHTRALEASQEARNLWVHMIRQLRNHQPDLDLRYLYGRGRLGGADRLERRRGGSLLLYWRGCWLLQVDPSVLVRSQWYAPTGATVEPPIDGAECAALWRWTVDRQFQRLGVRPADLAREYSLGAGGCRPWYRTGRASGARGPNGPMLTRVVRAARGPLWGGSVVQCFQSLEAELRTMRAQRAAAKPRSRTRVRPA